MAGETTFVCLLTDLHGECPLCGGSARARDGAEPTESPWGIVCSPDCLEGVEEWIAREQAQLAHTRRVDDLWGMLFRPAIPARCPEVTRG